jgi:hypothetical protein
MVAVLESLVHKQTEVGSPAISIEEDRSDRAQTDDQKGVKRLRWSARGLVGMLSCIDIFRPL